MGDCPSCGHANEPGARFCSACGVPLAQPATPRREERKVVTVLFADLVGFTSRSERLDPEDVRAMLSPYYARLRSELEHHGGTVEKFIGDAVMALFGAPAAHEDDPERAVRAALAIRDWARAEPDIQVRIGVTTGEALVALDARPSAGEGMASGDVVNTAARLQSAAPVNGVLVGERTYRATRHVIDYDEHEPVTAKGKEQPVEVWEAVQARARYGVDVLDVAALPLVGRERELRVLHDVLDRVLVEHSPQLLTLVGVPGIGKSRLLHELWRLIDDDARLVTWRQGRSLPYGHGLSFWALGEMVKAHAGILDNDTAEEAQGKLEQMVGGAVSDPSDAEWVLRHLRPLVDIQAEPSARQSEQQDEVFAAWRRLFEALAEQRPLVLVFEDIHWADDGLLDFVDHLVDWVIDLPLLVVCSARPELLARRRGWGGGKANATTLSLAPLSDEETASLISAVLNKPLLDATQQQALLARAGGNPLFAEQFARMLSERGGTSDLPLPETIQGIISARLDSLPVSEKQLLQDAAVIGKVFWPGAVAAVDDAMDESAMTEVLHGLEQRQFVRRERRSTMAGEPQYAFVHVLLRDAAYAQMPRPARMDKHVRAAAWLEKRAGSGDSIEMLAHHYLSAVELARSSGADPSPFVAQARAALAAAGERAQQLNAFYAAMGYFEAALSLWPDDADEARAELTFRLARARDDAGDDIDGVMLEDACAALEATGSPAAAEAQARLTRVHWLRGDSTRAQAHLDNALRLVRDAPDSPRKAVVIVELARYLMVTGRPDVELTRQSVRLCDELGLDELRTNALITLGTALLNTGDNSGLETMEKALAFALENNYLTAALRGYSNIGYAYETRLADLRAAARSARDACEMAHRQGSRAAVRWANGNYIITCFEVGDWADCAEQAAAFIAESAVAGSHYHDAYMHCVRGWMAAARGKAAAARDDVDIALHRAESSTDVQVAATVRGICASALAMLGDVERAGTLVSELLTHETDFFRAGGAAAIDIVFAADLCGEGKRAGEVVGSLPTRWGEVAVAVGARRYAEAARLLDEIGEVRLAAVVRLRAAEELAAAGRTSEARIEAEAAAAFFRGVGATALLRRVQELIPATA